MANNPGLHLKLSFEQVLDLVRQLPLKQRKELADILEKDPKSTHDLSEKEQLLLTDLEEAIDFVNDYPKGKSDTKTFQEMLDAL